MNIWQKIYEDRLSQAEKKLEILAREYNRIGKSEKLKPMRKIKVKEIKMQCQKIRNIKKEYSNRVRKEKKK